ncbi:MAG: kynureninase [Bacteroidota bacterium]|nr:kynureninase [Bacteroidota bacterium]
MLKDFNKNIAKKLDKEDTLSKYRDRFFFPKYKGKKCIYFCGNSLGLQIKKTEEYIKAELNDWAKYGVDGHFKAKNPWFTYHKILTSQTSKIVGAKKNEVVVMNGLTTNIHLLLMSFYKPNKNRYKILCESNAFPSDLYVLQSQVELHGYKFEDAVVQVPCDSYGVIDEGKLIKLINKIGDKLALVFIGGVNYYSGQVFNISKITSASHKVGSLAGFDLAHAAGNIELNLHKWNVDFAAWCSYKYLNSGPGNVSGIFVHENQSKKNPFRLKGWWGHSEKNRFNYNKKTKFSPMKGAEGWQLSNAPVFGMAAHKASLDVFVEAGMNNLVKKSKKLVNTLELVFERFNHESKDFKFKIITPKQRGCQLSVLVNKNGRKVYEILNQNGVVVDWREPNVIRFAPVPLYNSFEDIYNFSQILRKCL